MITGTDTLAGRSVHWPAVVRLMAAIVLAVIIAQCSTGTQEPGSAKEKYQLSEGDAWLWDNLYIADAETTAAVFWGLVGHGQFDEAMLMIRRFDDDRMTRLFENRLEKLWKTIHQWPANTFTEEPGLGLGKSETIGFRTWGELWSSGFQRAVICDDSITVYFVFKGYWQTDSIPLYEAVSCGDFGEESPQWRPFPIPVFSIDGSEPTLKVHGVPVRCRTLDDFCSFLRTRTYGTMGN